MRAFAPKLNYSFQSSGMYSIQKFAFSLSLFPHLFALVALNFFLSVVIHQALFQQERVFMKSTGGSEARFELKFSGQSGMICIIFISLQILYATY